MNEIDKYFSKSMDKVNPVIMEAIASEVWEKTSSITIRATGVDTESGIGKYEFYVDGILYNTDTSSEKCTNITLTFLGS